MRSQVEKCGLSKYMYVIHRTKGYYIRGPSTKVFTSPPPSLTIGTFLKSSETLGNPPAPSCAPAQRSADTQIFKSVQSQIIILVLSLDTATGKKQF